MDFLKIFKNNISRLLKKKMFEKYLKIKYLWSVSWKAVFKNKNVFEKLHRGI